MEHIRYKKETEVVTFQGKEITLENLSPVFTPAPSAPRWQTAIRWPRARGWRSHRD